MTPETALLTDATTADSDLPELVVVIPSRGRPETVKPFLTATRATMTARTRLVFALDSDDPCVSAYINAAFTVPQEVGNQGNGVVADEIGDAGLVVLSRNHTDPFITVGANGSMIEALNRSALFFAWMSSASAVTFLSDYTLPRTQGWDRQLLTALADMQGGLAYMNVNHLGKQLPAHVAISSEIIRALGFFAPPALKHFHMDEVWHLWGSSLGRLGHLSDIVVEHLDSSAEGADGMESGTQPHSQNGHQPDLARFREYVFTRLAHDMRTINAALRQQPAGQR